MPDDLVGLDVEAFVRTKISPMVQGLFPADEQPAVIEMLSRSVIFLTSGNIESVLQTTSFLSTAWALANLYLLSRGVELLSSDAPEIVGLSEGTTCYVSTAYFHRKGHLEDFVVHEAAHIFHNCKREMIGLPETRRREWLLDIDFAKRETFAYSCEAYSRILELGKTPLDRFRLLSDHAGGPMPPDDRVDKDEYVDILREAVSARNGWKRILDRCAPTKHSRRS